MPENLPSTITNEVNQLSKLFAILDPAAAMEIRRVNQANMGAHGEDEREMDRIKVPAGGAQSFIAQGIDGEEHLREVNCIILGWNDRRAYYKTAFDQRGKQQKNMPPDCSSRDGFTGVGNPGGPCIKCPFAAWGSDPKGGRGQACKQIRQMLILRTGLDGVETINVPPTSRKAVKEYFRRLKNRRIPYYAVVTNLRLERVENADGMAYSRMVFSAGPQLNPDQRATLEPFQEEMLQALANAAIDADYEVVPEHVDFTPPPGDYTNFAPPTDD